MYMSRILMFGWILGILSITGNGWSSRQEDHDYARMNLAAKIAYKADMLPKTEAKNLYIQALSVADLPSEPAGPLKGMIYISLGKLGFPGTVTVNREPITSVQCLVKGMTYFQLDTDLGKHQIISALISLGNSKYPDQISILGQNRTSKQCLEYAGKLASQFGLKKALSKVLISYGNAREPRTSTKCYIKAVTYLEESGIQSNSVLLAQGYLGHGNVLAEKGKWDAAYDCYKKALEVLPSLLWEEGLNVKKIATHQIEYIDGLRARYNQNTQLSHFK